MCWLFIGYCIVCTSTSHAGFTTLQVSTGDSGVTHSTSRVSLWGERVQPLCYNQLLAHPADDGGWEDFPSTASGRALSTLRRLCIQNDFVQVSGVNQCSVTVSLLVWIQQIALWFEVVLRRCQRHPESSETRASVKTFHLWEASSVLGSKGGVSPCGVTVPLLILRLITAKVWKRV